MLLLFVEMTQIRLRLFQFAAQNFFLLLDGVKLLGLKHMKHMKNMKNMKCCIMNYVMFEVFLNVFRGLILN